MPALPCQICRRAASGLVRLGVLRKRRVSHRIPAGLNGHGGGLPARGCGVRLHGFAGPCWGATKASCPTTFPAPPTLGNAWNLSAVRMMGSVISTEHRAWHNSEGHRNASTPQGLAARSGSQTLSHNGVNVWGPTLNVNRDPRWCAPPLTPRIRASSSSSWPD